MERHPYVLAMRAYLDGIQSTVGKATLRERESRLLYLFKVMLELRLSTDPRIMDKEEIDALVLWMRERNLGLAYQAKLWQYIRGLLAFVGNNILDVMKARGQWKPPKRAYRPVTVEEDGWFSDTVARRANETGWRARMVLAATAIYYHTGLRPKELRLAALRDLDLQRWVLTVRHPKGEGAWAVDGERVRLSPRGAAVRPRLHRFPGGSGARARPRPSGIGAPVPQREGRVLQRAGLEDGPVQGLPEPRYRCELQGSPGELRAEAQGPRSTDRERQYGAPAPDGGDDRAVLCPRLNGSGVGRDGD